MSSPPPLPAIAPPRPTHLGLPILIRTRSKTVIQPPQNVHDFVANELDLSRLNEMVRRSLWLAGRIGNIRPLHRQRLLGRRIVISEQIDLHLLWKDDVIYIKPLPSWILDESFFKTQIELTSDASLLAAANGFLMSYAFLITYQSDFHIAKECHLVPEGMAWADWQSLVETELVKLYRDINAGITPCAPRFQFGELRLSRVNSIYRFHPEYRFQHVIRGYHYGNQTYSSFLHRNFAWLIAVFAYITIVLTAMQVGLGTADLRDNVAFNRASYGFTVFAILLPLWVLAIGIGVSLVLTVYHVLATRRHLEDAIGVTQPAVGKV